MNLYLVVFAFFLMYLSIASSVEKSSKSSNKSQSVILKKSLMQSKAKAKRGEKGNAKVSNFTSLPAKKKRLRKKSATARKRRRKVLRPFRIVRKDLNNTKLENEVVKKEIEDVKKTEKPGSTKVGMFFAMPAKKKIRKRRGKVVRPIRNVQKDLNNMKLENEVIKKEIVNVKQKGGPCKDGSTKVCKFLTLPATKSGLRKTRKRRRKDLKPIRNVQKSLKNTRLENEAINEEKINAKREEPNKDGIDDKNKTKDTNKTKLDYDGDDPILKELVILTKRDGEMNEKQGSLKKPPEPRMAVDYWWHFCKPFSKKFCREIEETKCLKRRKDGWCILEKIFYVARNIKSMKKVGNFDTVYTYVSKNDLPHELNETEMQELLSRRGIKVKLMDSKGTNKYRPVPKKIQKFWNNYRKEKCDEIAPRVCKVVVDRKCIKHTARGCVKAKYFYELQNWATNETKKLPPEIKTVDPDAFPEVYGGRFKR